MTRKQYRQFAAMLANLRVRLSSNGDEERLSISAPTEWDAEDIGYGKALIDVENALCVILKADNPRFDAARFRDAAQPRNATSTHAVYAS